MIAWASRLLPKSHFARNVSVLVGGAVAGQVVVIAASPILTRIYSPEDFGLLAVFAALMGLFGTIASLRYHLAIPLPKSDTDALSLVALSSLILLVMTLILTLGVIFFGHSIARAFNAPLLRDYMWLLPVGFFLSGIYQIFNSLAIRQGAFRAIAQTKIGQAILMTLVQIGGYAVGPLALILGRILGQSAGIFMLIRTTRMRTGQPISEENRLHRLRAVGSRYRNFPYVSTWSGLASAGASNFPPLLIAALFGPTSAGLYEITRRVLSQPMAVFGTAVGNVFYGEAAQAHREGKLPLLVDSVYVKLVTLSLPIAILIFLAVPPLFGLLFGEKWEPAGEIARWITTWLFFQFIASPPTRVFPILDEHGAALKFQLGLLASSAISLVIGAMIYDSFVVGVAIMSTTNVVVYASRLMLTYSLLCMSPFRPFRVLAKSAPWSILCNFPLVLALVFKGDMDISKPLGWAVFFASAFLVSCFVLIKAHRYNQISVR